jgi:hypothetical protein
VLFGIALASGTILSTAWAVHRIRQARLQVGWPTVSGRILTSSVDNWAGSTQPNVEYCYEFRGKTFWNNTVWKPEVTLHSRESARKLIVRFPVGLPVTVYVNPDDPGNAVLIPGGDYRFVPTTVIFAATSFLVAVLSILQ